MGYEELLRMHSEYMFTTYWNISSILIYFN